MNINLYQDDMDYKNLFVRFFISLVIIAIYFQALNDIKYLFILGLIIYVIIFYEILKNFHKYLYLILLYISVSFLSFSSFLYFNFDVYVFNLLILTIITFDTFSYIVGSFFGTRYIFKKTSPNKTLEGCLGGLFFTNIFCIYYAYYIIPITALLILIILFNILIISALFGDLVQSFFKRNNMIKNSSNFLPGHGGFFDRFDSFISSIILLNVYGFIFL